MTAAMNLSNRAATRGTGDLRRTGIHPDHWYPVARSKDVKAGKAIGVSFAGEPIVLVRSDAGTLFALEDRCAHRQVPLHHGVVLGEQLRCCYHGWTYDRTGRCVSMPSLAKDGSPRIGVRAYPCREEFGFVFVFPGDPSKQDAVAMPDLPSYADPRYKTRRFGDEVRCHYSFLHENLMDMNHQFLHRRLMGSIKAIPLGTRSGEDWVEADYRFDRGGGKRPIGERFILNRETRIDDPAREVMTIRTQYPYQILKIWMGREEPLLDVWIVYVPVDREQRINRTFGLLMVRKPPIPGAVYALWPVIAWFTERIFAEDRWVVEEEQRAYDAQGADWNQDSALMRELKALLVRRGVPLSPA